MSGFVNAISSGHGVHRSGRREFKLYNVLFFRLDAKEKIPKERIKAAFFLLLTSFVPLKGLELASLKQSPLFDASLRAFAWRRKNEAGGRSSTDTTVKAGIEIRDIKGNILQYN